MRRFPLVLAGTLLATVPILASCGVLVGNPDEKTGDDSKSPKGRVTTPSEAFEPQQSSGLFIHLMDAPVDDAAAVNVKIAHVEARHEEQGWVRLSSATDDVIDLLALQQGKTLVLVDGDTPPEGLYQELRLVLDGAYEPNLVLADDSTAALRVPGGESSGLKIKSEFNFDVKAATEIVLDFDLRKSIKQTGKTYHLDPVLRAVEKSASGFITGSAATGSIACLYPQGAALDADAECAQALASAKAHGNAFTLAFVPVGTYNLRVFEGGAMRDYSDIVVTGRETTRVD